MVGKKFSLVLLLLLLSSVLVMGSDIGDQIRSEILTIKLELQNSKKSIQNLGLEIFNLEQTLKQQKESSETFSLERQKEIEGLEKSLDERKKKQEQQEIVSTELSLQLTACQKRLKFYSVVNKSLIGGLVVSIIINIIQGFAR